MERAKEVMRGGTAIVMPIGDGLRDGEFDCASNAQLLRFAVPSLRAHEQIAMVLRGLWGHRIPALRERPEDMPTLVARVLDRLGASPQTKIALPSSPEFLVWQQRAAWPGNIRELRNHLDGERGPGGEAQNAGNA